MDITKKKEFIINILYYGIILAAIFVAFKYLLPILVPFIIAFIIAWLTRKPTTMLHRRTNINENLLGMIVLILFYLVIGTLIVLAALGLISFANDFFRGLPAFIQNDIRPFLDGISLSVTDMIANLPEEIRSGILAIINSLDSAFDDVISSLSSIAISFATGVVTAVPATFVSIVLCIISSFFFVVDYDKVTGFAYKHMNAKMKDFMDSLTSFMKNKAVVIIKSYAMIMCITFVELSLGFFIIGLDGFIWIALSIAIFDILPVFGTGGIMIPWALITLLNGNITLGIELAIIYVIVTVIRNIIEPKIVGGNLGLHPVLTLASMLVGAHFFGVVGLFGLPLMMSFILYLKKEDKINLKALRR